MKKILTITTAILVLSSMNAMANDYQKQERHKSNNSTLSQTVDDAKIVTVVNGNLVKDKELSALKINVDSDKGHVILRGTAPNASSKERAERIAKNTHGVVSVDNRIEIGDSTYNRSDKMSNNSQHQETTVGEKIDDAALNVAINSALATDSQLSSFKINVDVTKGDVLLKGTAPTLAAKNRATQLTKAVNGVKSVNNQLMISK